jgi:hypothetical protein
MEVPLLVVMIVISALEGCRICERKRVYSAQLVSPGLSTQMQEIIIPRCHTIIHGIGRGLGYVDLRQDGTGYIHQAIAVATKSDRNITAKVTIVPTIVNCISPPNRHIDRSCQTTKSTKQANEQSTRSGSAKYQQT